MSMAIDGGSWYWVATFDNGLGLRKESEPYPATDGLNAWAKASAMRRDLYPDGFTVRVKEHHPQLDMIERNRR